MINRLSTSVILTLVVATASQMVPATSAYGAPMNCMSYDAPPQCQHLPPAPPVALRSASFEPGDGLSSFELQMFVDPSVFSGLSSGQTTRYRAWLECANGYSQPFPLKVGQNADRLVTDILFTSGSQVNSSCSFATWNENELAIDKVVVDESDTIRSTAAGPVTLRTWDATFE